VPDNISGAFRANLPDIKPVLAPKEERIIDLLSVCRAACRPSLERFWHPLKGMRKIQSLLNWGVLWSYHVCAVEVVTLPPLTAHRAPRGMYIPRDMRETVKTILATELFLRVMKNIPCRFIEEPRLIQGTLAAEGFSIGILVPLRDDPGYLEIRDPCLVICQDREHIKEMAKKIAFQALYTTHEQLLDRSIDIAHAFCDGDLKPKLIGSFAKIEPKAAAL